MRRRLFLLSSGSAAASMVLTACGGGGGGSSIGAEAGAAGSAAAGTGSDLPLSVVTNPQQPQPAPATSAPARGYPFGSRLEPYVTGTRPSVSTQAMDATLKSYYDDWKRARVIPANSVVAGGYAVKFSDSVMCVSEGMGYGMLLAVIFAGHDPQAQTLFDGLLAVVRARPSYGIVNQGHDPNGKYLMDWKLNADGSSLGGGWNALDGDLDIAMALLMADRQWGSDGKWNYLQEAKNTINAMKSWNMKPDGTTKGLPSPDNNRTSDYMIGHFRAFKKATGDSLWDAAVDRAFALSDRMQTVYSPGVGLMPDFVVNTHTATPSPSPGFIGDGNDKEHHYYWNACRNPWRFASDYLLSGDNRFALITNRMTDFFLRSSGGNAAGIAAGYALDGTKLTSANSACFTAPICAGACIDSKYQAFVDATWNWNVQNHDTGYYGSELQLLSMVVASGNWWSTARG